MTRSPIMAKKDDALKTASVLAFERKLDALFDQEK